MNILVWKRRRFLNNHGNKTREHRAVINGTLEEVITPKRDGTYATTWSGESFATLPLAKERVRIDLKGIVTRRGMS